MGGLDELDVLALRLVHEGALVRVVLDLDLLRRLVKAGRVHVCGLVVAQMMRVSLALIAMGPPQVVGGREPCRLEGDLLRRGLRLVHVGVRGQALGVVEKVALCEA